MTFDLNLPWSVDPNFITREEHTCEDCGRPLVVVAGGVNNAARDLAVVFFVGEHDHEQHRLRMSIGVPAEGWETASRPIKLGLGLTESLLFTFSLELALAGYTLTDPDEQTLADAHTEDGPEYLGYVLTRDEAKAHPWSGQLAEIVMALAGVIPEIDEAIQALEMFRHMGKLFDGGSRARGLVEGWLVDATAGAAEVGFSFPTALTRRAWDDLVRWRPEDEQRKTGFTMQSENGRLYDVMWMALQGARAAENTSDFTFELSRVPREGAGSKPAIVTAVMRCTAGDDGSPVLTILLPGED